MRNVPASPAVRGWLYTVFAAAVPLGVYFGYIEPEASPLILGFLLAIFNLNQPDDE